MSLYLTRRRLIGFATSGGVAVFLPGCTTPDRGPTVPMGEATQATVLGIPNERFFPLTGIAPLEAEFNAAVVRLRQSLDVPANGAMPEMHLLALSGGGENGAFGAGLLCGWT